MRLITILCYIFLIICIYIHTYLQKYFYLIVYVYIFFALSSVFVKTKSGKQTYLLILLFLLLLLVFVLSFSLIGLLGSKGICTSMCFPNNCVWVTATSRLGDQLFRFDCWVLHSASKVATAILAIMIAIRLFTWYKVVHAAAATKCARSKV